MRRILNPKYIEQLPDRLLELYAEVELDILVNMAERLSKLTFIPAAQWQYYKLIEMGAVHDTIVKKLAEVSGLTRKEIEALMQDASFKAVDSDSRIYRKAGLSPSPLDASPSLQAVLQAGIDSTEGLFDNLTCTTANTATRQFVQALDRAWLQINTGAFDYNTAVRSAIKDLSQKGLAVISYPTGHTDYLETAVRRAVVTGVNQTALRLQDTLANELGSDLVETTAHAGARNTGTGPANHAEWQGKIFSRSGRHPKYPDFRISTGYGIGEGLGGWNCRHSFFPYFEGQEPVYTKEELEDLNAPIYEYDGRKLTEYEATQTQRGIEGSIRRWKREYKAMEAAGQSTDEAASRLTKWQQRQKNFISQTGLKRQYDRENIPNFGNGDAKKLAQQARINYTKKQEEVRDLIRSPETPKALNIGSQNKHIQTSKGYIAGRSYIYGDLQAAQELVNQYHGSGEIRFTDSGAWINKEFILLDHDMGVWINQSTGEQIPTNSFGIHYGKNGSHIVPAKRRERK